MDHTAFSLILAGLILTAGGATWTAIEAVLRTRNYRLARNAARDTPELDATRRHLARKTPQTASYLAEGDTARVQAAVNQLEAATGAAQSLWRLAVSAAIALAGVIVSGVGDLIAIAHQH